jgi:hypothetical protein
MTQPQTQQRVRAVVLVAAGVGVAVALVVAVVATHHASPSTISPLRPSGTWRGAFVAALVAAFALYAVAVALALRWQARWPILFVLAVAIQLAPLGAPLLLSKDAYAYWGYGRIAAVHHANPYRDAPNRWPTDPAYPLMGADWHGRTSVYGPAFTLAAEGDARIAGGSARVARSLFRALAAAALLAVVALAAAAARQRAFAICFVGWNPLLALHFAGGGHNDAAMAAFIAGALALRRVRRGAGEGVAWAAAASVKLVALVFLALRALEAWRRREFPRLATGFGVAAAAIATVATIRYGAAWLEVVSPLRSQLGAASSLGIPYQLGRLGAPERAVRDTLLVLFVLWYAWLAWEALRGRAQFGRSSVGLLLALAWLQPWYIIWAVPFAAVEEDVTVRVAAVVLSAYFLQDALRL